MSVSETEPLTAASKLSQFTYSSYATFLNAGEYTAENGPAKDDHVASTRLLDRDADWQQSKGGMNIKKRIRTMDWRRFYCSDWYHSLVDSPTYRSVLLLLSAYLLLVVLFAFPYYILAVTYHECSFGIKNMIEAFMFSLETMATIGYGTQDIFFGDCYLPAVLISLQVLIKLIADAVTIGIIYSRLGRPNKRASTVLFSSNAVIRRIRDKLYFMFQLCELRKHQLTDAHVRIYCIRHERDPVVGGEVSLFQTCTMRLNHPNDELGSHLLLCLPQVVVHEIDEWSPLMPPKVWATHSSLYEWVPWWCKSSHRTSANTHRHDTDSDVRHNQDFHQTRASNINAHKPNGGFNDNPNSTSDAQEDADGSKPLHIDTNTPGQQPTPSMTYQFNTLRTGPTTSYYTPLHTHHQPFEPTQYAHASSRTQPSHQRSDLYTTVGPRGRIRSSSVNDTLSMHSVDRHPYREIMHKSHEYASLLSTPIPVIGHHHPHPHPSSPIDEPPYEHDSPYDDYYFPRVSRRSDHECRGDPKTHRSVEKSNKSVYSDPGSATSSQPVNSGSSEGIVSNAERSPVSAPGCVRGDADASVSAENGGTAPPLHTPGSTHTPLQAEDSTAEAGHSSLPPIPQLSPSFQLDLERERCMIERYMLDRRVEVMAIVEGVDPTTGGTVQARHSYTTDEIQWNKMFMPCVSMSDGDGSAFIDFELFHELRNTDVNAVYCGAVSSHI